MLKRIAAWILLIGFILLIVSIYTGFYWKVSLVVYLIIAGCFLLTNKKGKG